MGISSTSMARRFLLCSLLALLAAMQITDAKTLSPMEVEEILSKMNPVAAFQTRIAFGMGRATAEVEPPEKCCKEENNYQCRDITGKINSDKSTFAKDGYMTCTYTGDFVIGCQCRECISDACPPLKKGQCELEKAESLVEATCYKGGAAKWTQEKLQVRTDFEVGTRCVCTSS